MNREAWLKAAESKMIPWIQEERNSDGKPYTYPNTTRISCGFPKSRRGGKGNHAIGQCWTDKASGDSHTEMFICPTQSDAARVCDILLHEMVHATVGVQAGHKKPFGHLARALGMDGKLTATVAGPILKERIDDMLKTLPPYPHAELKDKQTTPKQATALLKVECDDCGYIARVTAKWINTVGTPVCQCSGNPMTVKS